MCWLDPEPKEATGAVAVNDPLVSSAATVAHTVEAGCGTLMMNSGGPRQ